MEVVYANCFGAPERDVLITDELGVARGASDAVATVLADERYDPEVAQATNERLAELAYSWARIDGADPTFCDGVAAADLAGNEALLTLLLPAARGVLDAQAALESPTALTVVVPRTSDPRFDRVERVIGEGFAAAAGLPVDWMSVADPRTDALVAKYALTRNPAFRPRETVKQRVPAAVVAAGLNLLSRMRGSGPTRVLVFDYHPTAAFARVYRANGSGPFGLMRFRFGLRDVATMARAGDRALAPLGSSRVARCDAGLQRALSAYVERNRDDLRAQFTVAGVDLWQVVGERLMKLALDYASWMQPRIGRVRRALLSGGVGAVLLPFDGPPEARLVLRVAQALQIPTLVINDGWKGDDYQQEGMAADRALAWSSSIARDYYRRRRHGHPTLITGNPRSDEVSRRPRRAPPLVGEFLSSVLVGSFTFSPSDLNCRRSDPERFLEEVLDGIAASRRARGAHVLVKLHPADRPDSYRDALERFAELDLELRCQGDVIDLFGEADVYITTYSTSLLEAAAVGLLPVYYRVNQQRLHAPFADDERMAARTAASSQELAALLDTPDSLALPSSDLVSSWVHDHLGPTDGRCSERVAAALLLDAKESPRNGLVERPHGT
jgi:hypothetical protein